MQIPGPTAASNLAWRPQGLSDRLLLEDAPLDEFEGQEDSALLLQRGGVGGHGARCDAPDVRVVPAAGHVEHRPHLTRPKHRSDDGQVWQVAAPCAGVVAQQHIARVEVSPQVLDLKPGDRCRVGRVQGQGWRRG